MVILTCIRASIYGVESSWLEVFISSKEEVQSVDFPFLLHNFLLLVCKQLGFLWSLKLLQFEVLNLDTFFLNERHPSDTPGVNLVPILSLGSENYSLWSRYIKIALLDNNKLGFVQGRCLKENYDIMLHNKWEWSNAIVLSWIMNIVHQHCLCLSFRGGMEQRFDKMNGSRIYYSQRDCNII